MSNNDILTDDYVADLLIEEAKDCSLKYSAMGMDALGHDKKPESMPKPNTRFLRNVIKSTDAHNKALLAREATQSQARFKKLDHTEEAKKRRLNPSTGDVRKRQLGQINAMIGGTRRTSDRAPNPDERPRDERSHVKASDLTSKSKSQQKRRRGRLDQEETRSKDCRRGHEGTARPRRSRHRASDAGDQSPDRHEMDRITNRASRKSRRSRSPDKERTRRRHCYRHRSPSRDKTRAAGTDSDPDPLEDLVGPAPPPKHRGRGRIGGALDLDRRFSASYDPKRDVQENSDMEDNWSDQVEAYRDRQKLRLHQEQRMRDAGFAEAQIQKMTQDSSRTSTDLDVVWSKAGEVRAWDNGKKLDDLTMMEVDQGPGLFSET